MSGKLHITEVGRVAIPAADQDRALAFYVDKLGFEKRVDETFADGQMQWIEVAPKGAPTAIALTPPMEGGPTSVDSGIIISTDDIEADHSALKEAGVDVDPEIARWARPCRRCSGSPTRAGTRCRSSNRSSSSWTKKWRSPAGGGASPRRIDFAG